MGSSMGARHSLRLRWTQKAAHQCHTVVFWMAREEEMPKVISVTIEQSSLMTAGQSSWGAAATMAGKEQES